MMTMIASFWGQLRLSKKTKEIKSIRESQPLNMDYLAVNGVQAIDRFASLNLN